jgi:hypothetical protein
MDEAQVKDAFAAMKEKIDSKRCLMFSTTVRKGGNEGENRLQAVLDVLNDGEIV